MAKLSSNQLWLRFAIMAVASIGLVGFIDLAVQQNYRQSANDPQIQLAEDAAAALNAGSSPLQVVPTVKINRQTSLAPFVDVVNEQQQLVATNAAYGSDSPLPPSGVFDLAKRGERWFSWQTAAGKRYAAVVVADQHGYVVAARSLREVENREDSLRLISLLAMVGLFGLSALYTLALARQR